MNAVLIDDEKSSIETLTWLISKCSDEFTIEQKFTSPREAFKYLQNATPDVVFLDIQMEEMSGFELLKQMESIPFEIIFVTAYEEYAIQALKANALDYLLKPVDKDDLITAIERLKVRIEKKNSSNHIQNIIGQITYPASKKIAVSTFKSFEILDPEDILYCESESNYTRINLLNGKSILISKTLRIVEELLPVHMFLRINYSTVINVQRVKSFVREEGGYVVLDNGKTINVTKSRKDELMKRFNKI